MENVDYLNKLRKKSAYGWSLLSWSRWRGKRTKREDEEEE
jgi:hypothetical protein